jgi:hypothetical protein
MPLGAAIESVLGGLLYLTENKPLHKVIREDLTEAEKGAFAAAHAVWVVVQNTKPHHLIIGDADNSTCCWQQLSKIGTWRAPSSTSWKRSSTRETINTLVLNTPASMEKYAFSKKRKDT